MADIPGTAATRATLPRGADFTQNELERDGDSDWYRVELKKGTNYAFNADIELEPPFPDDGYVSLRLRLRDPSGRVLEEDEAETYDGYDAAPDIRTAAEIEVGQTRDLSFFYGGDVDTYGVDLVGGRSYDFAANDSSIDVALLDANGEVLARNPFGAIQGFEAPSTGRYFLRAEDEYGRSHSEYTLSVRGSPAGGRRARGWSA